MMHPTDRSGFTLIEIVTVLAVFTIGAAGMYAALNGGVSYAKYAERELVTHKEGRRAFGELADLLIESSAAHVDTAMRLHTSWNTGNDIQSDRFEIPNADLRHCPSAVCQFHTRQNLATVVPNYQCGHEYRLGQGLNTAVRGKHFPADVLTCPFDGTQLVAGAHLDGIKLLTSRQTAGDFSTNGSEPSWNNLVFVFPYARQGETCELRRYDVSISDLLAGNLSESNWTRFDATAPSFVDLLDLGEDGTTNGLPDGSVPLTSATSDAEIETFLVSTIGGRPSIVLLKRLGDPSSYPYRRVMITVALESGYTTFDVIHQDSSNEHWSTSGQFTRSPRVLGQDITEFAVSTNTSNPYDAATNPTGIENTKKVRVTIGSSRHDTEKGSKTWTHAVTTFAVAPRN